MARKDAAAAGTKGGSPAKTPTRGKSPVRSGSAANKSSTTKKAKAATPAMQPSGKAASQGEVYVYIPNLIGYARVALTVVGIALLYTANKPAPGESLLAQRWLWGLLSYSGSFILDFFDGYAARYFHQSSEFGAVLDMVTDRVSTMLLLMTLGARLDVAYFGVYAFLAALDYSSHWVQMYAAKGHHKTTNEDKNIVVRIFYGVYPFFGYCCAGTEFFYICKAALFFVPGATHFHTFTHVVLLPACVFKNIVNVAQLMSGFAAVAKRATE